MRYLLQSPDLLLTWSKEGCWACSLDAHFNGLCDLGKGLSPSEHSSLAPILLP